MSGEHRPTSLADRTIADFGEQWMHFQGNEGYYGSTRLLEDILGPLVPIEEVAGRQVAEIGSGTGRIVRMLLDAGAAHVFAAEPSGAFPVLTRNLEPYNSRVECARITGEHLPRDRAFDLVVSIGVLHHIPDPAPVVRAAHAALRPGGRLLVWLYGKEGNGLYLALTTPLRAISTRLPHGAVVALSRLLTTALVPYVWLCRRAPLPLAGYFGRVFGHMDRDKQVLIVYDQLRPAYARYYSRAEALDLLTAGGFQDVRIHHRHGYSWTVVGTRA